jgi:hypothetical protein
MGVFVAFTKHGNYLFEEANVPRNTVEWVTIYMDGDRLHQLSADGVLASLERYGIVPAYLYGQDIRVSDIVGVVGSEECADCLEELHDRNLGECRH